LAWPDRIPAKCARPQFETPFAGNENNVVFDIDTYLSGREYSTTLSLTKTYIIFTHLNNICALLGYQGGRHEIGKTFQGYVIELRLSRAARELLESKRTVSDIAFACGFNNLANFNRLFLAPYQIAPRSYRSK
jgi:YesN/AraC family two-component response regulator